MAKKKKNSSDSVKINDNEIDSKNAKIVLFVFGIGPIILLYF